MNDIKLTQYSHGAGCGCKIAPNVLEQILHGSIAVPDKNLLVGNDSRDDAAVYDLGNGTALISTTDFFMPIVDDPYNFGRIAAANAISDVYAMGGRPVLAIAILGWPINSLPAEVAGRVIEGGRSVCREAGIPLAGGHSIDSPEPIFGLAVNGLVDVANLKQNNKAKDGDLLMLTKALGVGIITTAEKRGLASPELKDMAARQMMQLNKVGEALGKISGVTALTDVTGFGLLGHLSEMCEGSGLGATLDFDNIPVISDDVYSLIDQGVTPGGTGRNLKAYRDKITVDESLNSTRGLNLLADPQTSGGLLIAITPSAVHEVERTMADFGLGAFARPIGRLHPAKDKLIEVS